jgi:gluconokinase
MDLVVGLDSGTTATKAVAVAADATVVATCSAGYPLLMPAPGHAELDPVRLQPPWRHWPALLCRCANKATE